MVKKQEYTPDLFRTISSARVTVPSFLSPHIINQKYVPYISVGKESCIDRLNIFIKEESITCYTRITGYRAERGFYHLTNL